MSERRDPPSYVLAHVSQIMPAPGWRVFVAYHYAPRDGSPKVLNFYLRKLEVVGWGVSDRDTDYLKKGQVDLLVLDDGVAWFSLYKAMAENYEIETSEDCVTLVIAAKPSEGDAWLEQELRKDCLLFFNKGKSDHRERHNGKCEDAECWICTEVATAS